VQPAAALVGVQFSGSGMVSSLGSGRGLGLGHHELRLRFLTRYPDDVGTSNRRGLGLRLSHDRFGRWLGPGLRDRGFGFGLDGFELTDRLILNA